MCGDFEQTYSCYHALVYRYLYARIQDEPWAQDLTQETFILVWENFQQARNADRKAWIFAIARNVLMSHWRKQKRRLTVPLTEADPDHADIPGAEEHLQELTLMMNLAQLDERQRTVVALRLAGHSNREAADSLGIKPENATMLYRRAVVRLRTRLTGMAAREDNP